MVINHYLVYGLVPARSGSKRVPDKNIRMLGNKPLMAWIIDAAKKSRYIDAVMVSTDSLKYGEIAKMYGAQVILRPEELARDETPSEEVLKHALYMIAPDIMVLLQPTSPFTNAQDLDRCIELLVTQPADTVISVRKIQEPPEWMFYMDQYLPRLHPLANNPLPEEDPQKREKRVIPTGGVYALWTTTLINTGRIYGDKVFGYEVPWYRGIDIDEERDFIIAEAILREGLV